MSIHPKLVRSTEDESRYVRRKLVEFNSNQVPNDRYEEVHLCFKDDRDQVIAGLISAICWNWMEIDILWVDERHRGQRLGQKLLEEAESIARAKECRFIKLNTFSFQAPEFYKKYGYEVMAIIENAPPGSKHYYYKKDLASGKKRTDSASRVIKASPEALYHAFVDPTALAAWLPPSGMQGRIHEFDARAGGTYRMSLAYLDPQHSGMGKTSDNEDIVQGRFLELIPNERIVQSAIFESEDPAFAGEMTMIWTFDPVPEGTRVAIVCENVPEGIRKEDHDAGLSSSLANLAAFTE